ncbi:MAG: 2-amino-4-hydroxy-6-hydroxymethyldihydropteridine diphosphokinase [Gammaproteobacteria bacterium]|nr:2-amino-4-hydroxy-6-hydroxymethyldihydropteridine diphosphokinase [Gammaproteobacteria bacterium]MBU1646213.1 2-amino-4-hydroxy-6-hydroxymethyldihydropteridine diphosphokinase [Gammaproteobacteria bacterium]MBU1972275.1 2-amino-4-hydroxy-6-hydroxymethyldihydropteridine diphosphokinase [Gammaproteobacteria bacterium]
MQRAYIALGANLGNPVATLDEAIDALVPLRGSIFLAMSSLYRTAPVGLKRQPDFINAVVAIKTHLSPRDLLDELFALEARFGRTRDPDGIRNAPRTLDLDLLLHGDAVLDEPGLTLPHPRMHERAFVLKPLLEIAPDVEIPGHGRATDLLARCADQRIHRLERRSVET